MKYSRGLSGHGSAVSLLNREMLYSEILPATILNLNFKRGVASEDLQLEAKEVQFFAQLAIGHGEEKKFQVPFTVRVVGIKVARVVSTVQV
jgi:hypothetical protein